MEPARREVKTEGGVTVSYLVLGGKEPYVVMIHGLAGNAREFLPTARSLHGRSALLVDQRGHGLSTLLPADVSREAFVADVVAAIEAEATGPVDLIGQSIGGHTAMLVAAARPDLVRRLVLLEAGEGNGSPEEHEELARWFHSWPVPFPDRESAITFLGDAPLARVWADDLEQRPDGLYPRFDPEVMVAAIRKVAVSRWAEWESVSAPTLVVYADNGMFTDEQKTRFVRRGRHVTRADLKNASHDAHLDAFDQWAQALHDFLSAR